MKCLPGNPFAELLESYADPRNSMEAVATLALAYEQRTTTLAIMIAANTGGDGVLEQAAEVQARLGVEVSV